MSELFMLVKVYTILGVADGSVNLEATDGTAACKMSKSCQMFELFIRIMSRAPHPVQYMPVRRVSGTDFVTYLIRTPLPRIKTPVQDPGTYTSM